MKRIFLLLAITISGCDGKSPPTSQSPTIPTAKLIPFECPESTPGIKFMSRATGIDSATCQYIDLATKTQVTIRLDNFPPETIGKFAFHSNIGSVEQLWLATEPFSEEYFTYIPTGASFFAYYYVSFKAPHEQSRAIADRIGKMRFKHVA